MGRKKQNNVKTSRFEAVQSWAGDFFIILLYAFKPTASSLLTDIIGAIKPHKLEKVVEKRKCANKRQPPEAPCKINTFRLHREDTSSTFVQRHLQSLWTPVLKCVFVLCWVQAGSRATPRHTFAFDTTFGTSKVALVPFSLPAKCSQRSSQWVGLIFPSIRCVQKAPT